MFDGLLPSKVGEVIETELSTASNPQVEWRNRFPVCCRINSRSNSVEKANLVFISVRVFSITKLCASLANPDSGRAAILDERVSAKLFGPSFRQKRNWFAGPFTNLTMLGESAKWDLAKCFGSFYGGRKEHFGSHRFPRQSSDDL